MHDRMRSLCCFVSVIVFLGIVPVRGNAAPPFPVVSVLNVKDGFRVKGPDLVLRLHVTPSPSEGHPDHFHLFINGRMVSMFKMTRPNGTIHLHHLPKGRDRVAILSADFEPLRSKEGKSVGGSSGTDLGDMGGMSMSEMRVPPRKIAPGTRLVLYVR
ncbi:MAG: hypothetical protein ACYCTV_00080 [Leptospirales bacterium]